MLDLRPYTIPRSYADAYAHNFHIVSALEKYPSVQRMIAGFTAWSDLPNDVLALELKRYVLIHHEYHPEQIAPRWGFTVFSVCKMVAYILCGFVRASIRGRHAVLVDDWSPGVRDHFYGEALLTAIQAQNDGVIVLDKDLWRISPRHALAVPFAYARGLMAAAVVRRDLRIELSGFVNYIVRAVAAGRTVKGTAAPRVIVSGNDNGFPVALAKAAGAELILVQNARKTLFSDAAFKYADVFVAMGDLHTMGIITRTGCQFGRVVPLGSIRLAHALASAGGSSLPASDLIWISDLEYSGDSERVFGRYYSMENEIAAIRLLNALAERTQWKIIHKCRCEGEIELLQSLGLHSPKIHYVGRHEVNTYLLALRARVVLSSVSTVVLEMLGIGRRAGLVNLSGNQNVNADLSPFGVEYTRDDIDGLISFVQGLIENPPALGGVVSQHPHYDEQLAGLIREMAVA